MNRFHHRSQKDIDSNNMLYVQYTFDMSINRLWLWGTTTPNMRVWGEITLCKLPCSDAAITPLHCGQKVNICTQNCVAAGLSLSWGSRWDPRRLQPSTVILTNRNGLTSPCKWAINVSRSRALSDCASPTWWCGSTHDAPSGDVWLCISAARVESL